ncbi:MAG: coproporphyrinogen III oxidase [Deltaproteobacteria bacterium]|nr:MAG: coproporphyrinogen III oxidase [Deltaproteobacteria bacterium]
MRTLPSSSRARLVLTRVERLQRRLADRMEAASRALGTPVTFEKVEWLRGEGRFGGGHRLTCADGTVFDRSSCNVSAVHYDALPEKRLASATALSCIVHPAAPLAPSMHMHMSYTEMRDGRGTWRLMADLNPSTPIEAHTQRFTDAIRASVGAHFDHGAAQGDKYFHIPALGRHRGVVHFYLEGHDSGDFDADAALVDTLSEAVIDAYGWAVEDGAQREADADADEAQLAYHTLYLFQVLTLDRGTTSGLLVHDENDLGIMGSLPSTVDPDRLRAWAERAPAVQRPLILGLAEAVPDGRVTDAAKLVLAATVRSFYREHPEALELQARGDVVPPTVANHQ